MTFTSIISDNSRSKKQTFQICSLVTKYTQNYIITKVPKTTTEALTSKEGLLAYLCSRLDIWWKNWETLAKEAGNQKKCETEHTEWRSRCSDCDTGRKDESSTLGRKSQTRSGVHPAYISMDTEVLSRDTAAWASRDLSHPSSAEVETEWRCTSTPPLWLHGM